LTPDSTPPPHPPTYLRNERLQADSVAILVGLAIGVALALDQRLGVQLLATHHHLPAGRHHGRRLFRDELAKEGAQLGAGAEEAGVSAVT
jgi:hypothetical protein